MAKFRLIWSRCLAGQLKSVIQFFTTRFRTFHCSTSDLFDIFWLMVSKTKKNAFWSFEISTFFKQSKLTTKMMKQLYFLILATLFLIENVTANHNPLHHGKSDLSCNFALRLVIAISLALLCDCQYLTAINFTSPRQLLDYEWPFTWIT